MAQAHPTSTEMRRIRAYSAFRAKRQAEDPVGRGFVRGSIKKLMVWPWPFPLWLLPNLHRGLVSSEPDIEWTPTAA